jgi:hypothetical protein
VFLLASLQGVNDECGIPIHACGRGTCNGVSRVSKERVAGNLLNQEEMTKAQESKAMPLPGQANDHSTDRR